MKLKKLYPTAELPKFENHRISPTELRLIYHSTRHLEDVAEGLVKGCMKHFDTPVEILREGDDSASEEGIRFLIRQTDAA